MMWVSYWFSIWSWRSAMLPCSSSRFSLEEDWVGSSFFTYAAGTKPWRSFTSTFHQSCSREERDLYWQGMLMRYFLIGKVLVWLFFVTKLHYISTDVFRPEQLWQGSNHYGHTTGSEHLRNGNACWVLPVSSGAYLLTMVRGGSNHQLAHHQCARNKGYPV